MTINVLVKYLQYAHSLVSLRERERKSKVTTFTINPPWSPGRRYTWVACDQAVQRVGMLKGEDYDMFASHVLVPSRVRRQLLLVQEWGRRWSQIPVIRAADKPSTFKQFVTTQFEVEHLLVIQSPVLANYVENWFVCIFSLDACLRHLFCLI